MSGREFMSMRHIIRFVAFAALAAVSVSCGNARNGQSPVFLSIDSLQGAPGNAPTTFGSVLISDIENDVTTGGGCTATAPCSTFFNDVGQAVMHIVAKDVTNTTAPTSNNDVTINRYHVSYRRADGHNTPGVDVPFAFDGAVTVTIAGATSTTVGFELVRVVAKQESPLVQLLTNNNVITTFADVTFYGTDRAGNAISVMGTIQIDFGSFRG
jgi:hypothetical protein